MLYKTTKQAEAALEALDSLILNNRSIEIKQSLKKGLFPTDTTNFTPNTHFTGLVNKMEGGKPGAANSKYFGSKPPIKNAYSRK